MDINEELSVGKVEKKVMRERGDPKGEIARRRNLITGLSVT